MPFNSLCFEGGLLYIFQVKIESLECILHFHFDQVLVVSILSLAVSALSIKEVGSSLSGNLHCSIIFSL